jgi:hypothetical protein
MNIAINDTKDKTDKIPVFDFMNKVSELIDRKLKPLVTKNSDDVIDIDNPTNFKSQLQNNVFSEDDWSAEAKKKNSRKRKKDEADEDYDNVESLSEQEVSFSNKQKVKKPKQNKRITKSKSMKEQIKESYEINLKSKTPKKPSLVKPLPQMPSKGDLINLFNECSQVKAGTKLSIDKDKMLNPFSNTQLPSIINGNIQEIINEKVPSNAKGLLPQISKSMHELTGSVTGAANTTLPRQGTNPLLMDPANLANAYYSEMLRNPISIQKKLDLVNMNRISLMQQALSNMFASTNLYQIMHNANWQSKPQGKIIFLSASDCVSMIY